MADDTSFEAYWNRLRKANPALDDGNAKARISVNELRTLLSKAFAAGEKHGKADPLGILDEIMGR